MIGRDRINIDAIIAIASRQFLSGSIVGSRQTLLSHFAPELFHDYTRLPIMQFPHFIDPHFPKYPASLITPHLIAAWGPGFMSVDNFIQNVLKRYPIKQTIGLGSWLAPRTGRSLDFINYSLPADPHSNMLNMGKHQIKIINSYDIGMKNRLNTNYFFRSSGQLQLDENKMIKSELQIHSPEEKETLTLTTTLFGVDEGLALTLDEKLFPRVYQIYLDSLSKPTLIHSTNGMGRTGQMILMLLVLELFLNLHRLDQNPDAPHCANLILTILNDIRLKRPGLVDTPIQFVGAIQNAFKLYSYVLENHLEEKIKNQPPHLASLPSFSKLLKKEEKMAVVEQKLKNPEPRSPRKR